MLCHLEEESGPHLGATSWLSSAGGCDERRDVTSFSGREVDGIKQ